MVSTRVAYQWVLCSTLIRKDEGDDYHAAKPLYRSVIGLLSKSSKAQEKGNFLSWLEFHSISSSIGAQQGGTYSIDVE